LKIIFAGTPHYAASALEALLANKHEVVAVLTQPDRPAGRGMQLVASPVKQKAIQHNIPVLQPVSLKAAEAQQLLASLQADVMVVAAYGLILPKIVLDMPRLGCLNIHASLLPRWRGAAPIQRAILAGDAETGITIMQMDEGLDTGLMLLKKNCPIDSHDTSQTLHDKLATLGAEAIVEVLAKLKAGTLNGVAQDSIYSTYAAKIIKSEAELDWTNSAKQLEQAIRAYNPTPIAYSQLNDTIIKIHKATVSDALDHKTEPGNVLEVNKQNIRVACGQGTLLLEVLQKPNGKPLPVAQFIQGFAIKVGDRFIKK
jgi:methionyl-tRNA formyltransferase